MGYSKWTKEMANGAIWDMLTDPSRKLSPKSSVETMIETFRRMTEAKRFYYLRDFQNIGDDRRDTYPLGPHTGRNANILWLVKMRLVQPAPPDYIHHEDGTVTRKHFVLTLFGQQVHEALPTSTSTGVPFGIEKSEEVDSE